VLLSVSCPRTWYETTWTGREERLRKPRGKGPEVSSRREETRPTTSLKGPFPSSSLTLSSRARYRRTVSWSIAPQSEVQLSTTRGPLDKHVRRAAPCVIKHQRRRQSRRHRRRSTTATTIQRLLHQTHRPFQVHRKHGARIARKGTSRFERWREEKTEEKREDVDDLDEKENKSKIAFIDSIDTTGSNDRFPKRTTTSVIQNAPGIESGLKETVLAYESGRRVR